MTYDSEIAFTLDTICPWTYLGRRRFLRALEQVRAQNPPVNFHVKYLPFELNPEMSQEGVDKFAWYRQSKYGDTDEKIASYIAIMSAKGEAEVPPIHYKFGGTLANTLQAHRVIQHFQAARGFDVAERLVSSLYRQYFEEERHPSCPPTLLAACAEAGIDEAEAQAFIDDEDDELMDVKMAIREQRANGIDAVPHVAIEGRRRDFNLDGCREVDEYVKTLLQVVKEAS